VFPKAYIETATIPFYIFIQCMILNNLKKGNGRKR